MPSRKPKPGRHSFTRKQLGAAMLEVLGSVGIGAAVLGGIADQTNRYLDSTKASTAGDFHRIASAAAAKYLASTSDDFTNPTRISWDTVRNTIPEVVNLSDTNAFQEQFCLLAKTNSSGRNQGVLIARNSTTAETQAGKSWRRSMMVNSGNAAMGRMTGANEASRAGTWRIDLTGWNVAGNCGGDQTDAVVTNLEILQLASSDLPSVLHRYDEGRPELNKMYTAIDMNSQDINNANTVSTDALQLSGTRYLIQSTSSVNLSATRDVIVTAGSQERMRISANGKVGIGTTDPSTALHIEGNQTIRGVSPTLYLRDTNDRSGMIAVQNGLMYFLRGCGVDSGS